MPIYEYHCRKCTQDFELMRKVAQMDDDREVPGLLLARDHAETLDVRARGLAQQPPAVDDEGDTDLDMQYGDGHDHGDHGDDDFDDDDY